MKELESLNERIEYNKERQKDTASYLVDVNNSMTRAGMMFLFVLLSFGLFSFILIMEGKFLTAFIAIIGGIAILIMVKKELDRLKEIRWRETSYLNQLKKEELEYNAEKENLLNKLNKKL